MAIQYFDPNNPTFPNPGLTSADPTPGNYFFVTRALPGNMVSALVNFVAPLGFGVQFDPSKNSSFGNLTAQFIPATGTKAFFLERQVLTNIPLEYTVFFKDFLTPEFVGNRVSARLPQEIIVESLQLVLTSGTGAISAGTAANTALGMTHGRWYVAQGGDETAGILREQITPAEIANVCRLRIEIPQ